MYCRFLFSAALVFSPFALSAFASDPPDGVNVLVLKGEGAINNIKLRTSRETVVQVVDNNHNAVPNASVAFVLPGDGPGGTFAGGLTTVTKTTDSIGRVVMPRFHVTANPGKFLIHVTASKAGVSASAVIAQSSVVGAAVVGVSIGAAAAIAGAVAAGGVAVVAVRRAVVAGGSPSPAPPVPPAGAVGLGGGAGFGPPH